MRSIHVVVGFVVMVSVFAPEPCVSSTALKPPATTLTWLLGNWQCKSYNYDSGSPQLRKNPIFVTFEAGRDGLTVLNRSLVDGQAQYDRITWNAETAHWLDIDEAPSSHEKLASAMTAEDVDVNDDGMVFTGFERQGAVEVQAMVVTTKTGRNSFTEQDEFNEDGDWKTVEMTYCKRTPV